MGREKKGQSCITNWFIRRSFLERPNRFIARCLLDGQEVQAHVNTDLLPGTLLPGATVYLEKAQNPQRKTAYSLIAVEKGICSSTWTPKRPRIGRRGHPLLKGGAAGVSRRSLCPAPGRSPTGIQV